MQFMLIEFVSSSCFACSDMMIAVGPRSVVGRCSWTPRGSARRLWLAGGSGCAGATRRGGDDDGELADVTYRAVAHADPPLLASSTSTTSKVVNDNLGHETDDALLVAVAQRLTSCARAADTVARLGGDEFVIIFDGVGAAEAAYSAERIIAALAAPVVADGHELLVRASIGIADGCKGHDASDLLRQADIAMYAAKGRGGSRFLRAAAVAATHATGARSRPAVTSPTSRPR